MVRNLASNGWGASAAGGIGGIVYGPDPRFGLQVRQLEVSAFMSLSWRFVWEHWVAARCMQKITTTTMLITPVWCRLLQNIVNTELEAVGMGQTGVMG